MGRQRDLGGREVGDQAYPVLEGRHHGLDVLPLAEPFLGFAHDRFDGGRLPRFGGLDPVFEDEVPLGQAQQIEDGVHVVTGLPNLGPDEAAVVHPQPALDMTADHSQFARLGAGRQQRHDIPQGNRLERSL